MFTSTTRAVFSGLSRAVARPLVLRPAPLVQRSFAVSAWDLKTSTGSAEGTKTKKTAAAKKPTTKKKAATKKTAAKSDAPAKKQKPARKPLSEEQKQKLWIRQLKQWALLDEPAYLPQNPWLIYVAQNYPKDAAATNQKAVDVIKDLGAGFKQISESKLEELRATAAANTKSNLQARKEWIESHPPELIYMAQIARKHLAKEAARKQTENGSKSTARRYAAIHDERIPKRAAGAYAMFIQSRFNKTDGQSAVEAMQDLAKAWKELGESEKRPFIELASSETEHASKVRNELKEKAVAYWVEHSTVTPSRAKSDLQRIG